jgi:hypothetical protein
MNPRHLAAKAAYAARKQEQVKAREARAQARALRTPEQQMAILDTMFGAGLGAQKERAKLASQME